MLDKKLSDILEEAARKSDDGPSVELLRDTWATLVGRDLARLTEPGTYSDGVLVIKVTSPEWKRELSYRRGTIIKRVNEVFPWRVSSIDFQVAEIERPGDDGDREWQPPETSSAPVDERTEAALEQVDPALKGTLRKIRRHMLRERDD
ncbi:MAG: DUF721 domain-containing protein [Myxococcota bacterium]